MERFLQESGGRGIDGLLYLAYDNDPDWPTAAPLLARLPNVVSVFGDPDIEGGSCVASDVAGGVRDLVMHLHQQGRRKIVQVFEDLDAQVNRLRYEGFMQAHRELGLPVEEDQTYFIARGLRDVDPQTVQIYTELLDDVVRRRRADAVLLHDDIGAVMVLRVARKLGLRVPQDLAVAGWGNETFARFTYPSLTTIDYRPMDLIGAALDLLSANVGREPDASGPQRITVPAELIVRESTTAIETDKAEAIDPHSIRYVKSSAARGMRFAEPKLPPNAEGQESGQNESERSSSDEHSTLPSARSISPKN